MSNVVQRWREYDQAGGRALKMQPGRATMSNDLCTLLSFDEKLSIVEQLLETLLVEPELYSLPKLRNVRKLVGKLHQISNKTQIETLCGNKYRRFRQKQAKDLQVAMDLRNLERTKLRSGRIQYLEEFAEQEGVISSKFSIVLDGAVNVNVSEVNDEASLNNVNNLQNCYICKISFRQLHHFYDKLCPECANYNWIKRNQSCVMTGLICLVTGGRVKIGFHCCLKLLRCGSTVIVTSRFPCDTAKRFALQPDFDEWKFRLHIYGLDLRNLVQVEGFCDWINSKYHRLDAIINNACQTIRRPVSYYNHLMTEERLPVQLLPAREQLLLSDHVALHQHVHQHMHQHMLRSDCSLSSENTHEDQQLSISNEECAVDCVEARPRQMSRACDNLQLHETFNNLSSAESSQICLTLQDSEIQVESTYVENNAAHQQVILPRNVYDVNGQQLDLRTHNSWTARTHEVSTPEVAEVFAINSIAPFILAARLKPLLTKQRHQCTASEDASKETAENERRAWRGGSNYRGVGPIRPQSSLSTSTASHTSAGLEHEEELDDGATAAAAANVSTRAHGAAKSTPVAADKVSFIVNVSSMEGKFYRRKLATHPHTNMAKAALNMMTRTSAADYQTSDIYMTAVDTGWINDENPVARAVRTAEEHNFSTPLDEIDAAARILDPIITPLLQSQLPGNTDKLCEPPYGCFFKDYFVTEW